MAGWLMQSALLLLLLICTFSPILSAKKKKELEIISEFKPEDCSEFADEGDDVLVHYTGKLETGIVFDSSREKDTPLPFKLGQGKVIPGWELGIKGMCPGEMRKLIIPSHLAYGPTGYPPVIPPDATLIFETELVALQKKSVEDFILPALPGLAAAGALILLVYYVYQKYQQAPSKKELKGDKKSRKKRK